MINQKPTLITLALGCTMVLFAFTFRTIDPSQDCDVDYKNLSSGDKRALNQKIKSCGCPTDVEKIVEYAAFRPSSNQARKLDGRFDSDAKTVIGKRSGYAYEFKSCKLARYWSDTGANGEVHDDSDESPDYWIGRRIRGERVLDNFTVKW